MTEPQIQANADPFEQIRRDVARYYADKAQLHGPTARGVDWNSEEGHRLRFDQLLRLIENDGPFSLLDYGCGYGALVEHLDARGARYTYQGYDIAEPMLVLARSRHTRPSVSFTSDVAALEPADYVVASGIFNVKQAVPTDVWQTYVLQTLDRLFGLARRGFAFNVLTAYSDADRMRDDLFYADPLALFEHCRTRFSRRVALLHDYPLYEFTLLVRT